MNLLIGAVTMGLIFAPLALGMFLSYRVYHTLDLTADGAFGVGAGVAAALLVHGHGPFVSLALAMLSGVGAGAATGLVHTRLLVSTLLAGVLTSTALYSGILFVMGSGSLSLASTDGLLTWAERLGARMGLPAEVVVVGTSVPGARLADLVLAAAIAFLLVVGLTRFLETDLGLAMRATGTNAQMARAVGIEVDRMLVVGLALANGLVATSGALYAEFQGFANIEMGIGALVTGVAMLLVGERLVGRRTVGRWVAGAAAGALVFRLLVALAIRAGLPPNALKLVTALFVLGVLVLPELARRRGRRAQLRAPSHA